MQACRNQFLTGTTFADDQHWLVEGCDLRDPVQDLKEGRGFANESVCVLPGVHGRGLLANCW